MFTKPLKYIFTTKALQEAYKDINKKSSGIDNITFEEFKKNPTTNISQIIDNILLDTYIPELLAHTKTDKLNSNKKRPIGLSAIKDKIIQKVLYDNLNPYFNKILSNHSFAYKPNDKNE